MCPDCKGKGVILLLDSTVPCEKCKPTPVRERLVEGMWVTEHSHRPFATTSGWKPHPAYSNLVNAPTTPSQKKAARVTDISGNLHKLFAAEVERQWPITIGSNLFGQFVVRMRGTASGVWEIELANGVQFRVEQD